MFFFKKKHINNVVEDPTKTIFINNEYCDTSVDYSKYTDYSYCYNYVKPSLLITKDNKEINLDGLIDKGGIIVPGVQCEYINSYGDIGERTRKYILYISKSACPIRIQYTSGSGEGYKDSNFSAFDHKEFWLNYQAYPEGEMDDETN